MPKKTTTDTIELAPEQIVENMPVGAAMSNEEKFSYVRTHLKMVPFRRTAKAILASIPASLIEALTVEQLVVVADALHAGHEAGKAKAEEEILAEGAIWSPKHGRLLEIEVPNA